MIGSTRHGWSAASGKTLLIDFTTISSVCATWMALSAAASGGGGKGAAAEKTRAVLNSGELSQDQHFLALGFESEGYVPEEAKKLLHAWAKLHKEDNDLTDGDMSLMLFKWTSELAFIRDWQCGARQQSTALSTRKCSGQRSAGRYGVALRESESRQLRQYACITNAVTWLPADVSPGLPACR